MKTTREAAKEESHKEHAEALQMLLQKNYDAEKGFKKAIIKTESDNLKEFLKRQAAKHNRFATELDKEIRSLNEHPKEEGSFTGKLSRAWMDIKVAVSGDHDEAILKECVRGEKNSAEEYKEALDENKFPPHLEQVLKKQLSDINTMIAEVKSMEDLTES
ncbi:MAG TPA: PA2169 family four-helix-bundle protein [Gillisia sp.]|nr:PA2169 family four-helix-bundle protein [Gillisia sp.]